MFLRRKSILGASCSMRINLPVTDRWVHRPSKRFTVSIHILVGEGHKQEAVTTIASS